MGPYRIVREIGSGGFATVYEGLHLHLQKRVAIKFLSERLADDPNLRTRFIAEGESASRIRHPNVVSVTDVGTQGRVPYLVMEFLDGEDLEMLLEREVLIPQARAAAIMLSVIAAIHEGHKAGVLHRDIKPANVYLTPNPHGEQPVVLDFGISELVDPASGSVEAAPSELRLGTPAYVPPERLNHGISSEKGDQYSLGILLYELVTGSLPYASDTMEDVIRAVRHGELIKPSVKLSTIQPRMEEVILRATSFDPNERFETLQGMGIALLPLAPRNVRVFWEASFGVGRASGELPPARRIEDFRPSESPRATLPDVDSSMGIAGLSDEQIRGALRAADAAITATSLPALVSSMPTGPIPQEERRAGRLAPLLLLLLVLLGGAVAVVMFWPRETPPVVTEAETFLVELDVEPETARIELDGLPVGVGSYQTELAADGRAHSLTIRADGYEVQRMTFVDSPPPSSFQLVERQEAPNAPAAVASDEPSALEVTPAPAVEPTPEPAPTPVARRRPRPRPRPAAQAAPVATPEPDPTPVAAPVRRRPTVETTANGAPILD